jgi:type IV pilus assembly protein PilB
MVEAGLVTEYQLRSVLEEQNNNGKKACSLLVERGLVTEEELLEIMEVELKVPRVNLNQVKIDPAATGSITAEMAMRYLVLPLTKNRKEITLAMADPADLAAIDDVAMITGLEVNPVLARESVINHLINQVYSLPEGGRENQSSVNSLKKGPGSSENTAAGADQSPVVRIVNSLVERAIREGASDIHLEPAEEGLRVRMRLDGVLHDLAPPPRHTRSNIISRVKIMAGLDIAEKRLSQDGNIPWKNASGGISLRVSTLPTVYGEKVVIRLLEKDKIVLPLEGLGFSEESYRILLRLLLNQHGMLLVTGPTGCGKTTTLYSALHYLNRPEDNIITVEDPVEYRLKGINQVQVNPRINRTFANALRSILRQDPNIIMIGEIRDLETAKIATQAALTGHLVLSTLHTNNAAGAVTRLIDMGLEEYLVSASLVGVIAQRLVRKICSHCVEEYRLNDLEKRFFQKYFQKDPPDRLLRGRKCSYCNHTGYRGRSSIQEILVISRELQELIIEGATAENLQKQAVARGMRTLAGDGLRFVEAGETTVTEIVRTTFSSIFDLQVAGDPETVGYMTRIQKEER